jgi:hypothetical protein
MTKSAPCINENLQYFSDQTDKCLVAGSENLITLCEPYTIMVRPSSID